MWRRGGPLKADNSLSKECGLGEFGLRDFLRSKWGPVCFGLGALYGAGCIVMVLTSPEAKQWPLFIKFIISPIAAVLLFGIASLISLAVHELGHLIAGRLVGFPWMAITIGPVSFVKTSSGIKPRWSGYKSLSGLAQCHIRAQNGLRPRLAGFILGGPIASLLLFALSYWVMRETDAASIFVDGIRGDLGEAFFRVFALMFFASAVSTSFGSLLPFGIRGVDTDALILWRLLRGGIKGERQVALAMLGAKISAGIRFRDWEPELISTALKPRDITPARLQSLFLAYLHEVDCGRFEEARALVDEASSIEPKIHEVYLKLKRAVRMEQAFAFAVTGQPEAAARMLGRLSRGDKESQVHRKRVSSAIAFADGRLEEANRLLGEYALELLKQPQPLSRVLVEAEIEWLGWVKQKYQPALAVSPALVVAE